MDGWRDERGHVALAHLRDHAVRARFAASQAEAARAIGYPVLALVTFQNVAASLATTASVPRVALAVSLARDGSAGVDSGRVLRTVLAVDIVVLVSLSGTAVLLPATLFA